MSQINKWIYSTNHKDIGSLYLILGILGGMVGTSMSMIIRMELSQSGNAYLGGDEHVYNVLISAHGLIMIFFIVQSFFSN